MPFTISVIYLELIFAKDVMSMSRFSFSFCICSVVLSIICSKGGLCPIVLSLSFDQLTVFMGVYFLALCSVPLIIFLSHLLPVLCCFDYWSFVVNPDVL